MEKPIQNYYYKYNNFNDTKVTLVYSMMTFTTKIIILLFFFYINI